MDAQNVFRTFREIAMFENNGLAVGERYHPTETVRTTIDLRLKTITHVLNVEGNSL